MHDTVVIGKYFDQDMIVIPVDPLNLMNRVQRPALDVISATVVVLTLQSPLLLLVAVVINLDSPGPAMWRQLRVGQDNRLFRIYKFRSMHFESNDNRGGKSVLRDNHRITRVSRFIRRTTNAEPPQILNVLRSQMRLISLRSHALGSLAGDAVFWTVSGQYWGSMH